MFFLTRYELFIYLVIEFEFKNAPDSFHLYTYSVFKFFIDFNIIIYLDGHLIFLRN